MTHFMLYFFYDLTTTTKHSDCSQRTWTNVPRFLLQEEGQRFQEAVKEISARLVRFLLQKVALWETI